MYQQRTAQEERRKSPSDPSRMEADRRKQEELSASAKKIKETWEDLHGDDPSTRRYLIQLEEEIMGRRRS